MSTTNNDNSRRRFLARDELRTCEASLVFAKQSVLMFRCSIGMWHVGPAFEVTGLDFASVGNTNRLLNPLLLQKWVRTAGTAW